MGTFSYFLGEMDIPEERREEFAQGALKLLRAGGMLIAEPTSMFGHQIYLLHPPELDEEGRAYGCYNYFEDDCWESWSLDAKNGRFACGKIGYRQFHAVALAMGVYTSLYCKSFSAATLESRLLYEGRFIGWINYVLGTQFTNWRDTQMWKFYKLLMEEDRESLLRDNKNLTALIWDQGLEQNFDINDLIFYGIVSSAPDMKERLKENEALARDPETRRKILASGKHDMQHCLDHNYLYDALVDFRAKGGTLKQAERYLLMPEEDLRALAKETGDELPLLFALPNRAYAAVFVAMVFDLEVFPYLDKLHDILPLRDVTDRTPVPCPPVPPISTQEWLKLDPDDMAYYWTPDGDVHFSDEMNAWMAGLALELDGIHVTLSPQEFLKTLFQNIAGCDKKSFFREAFYDFIAHQTDPRFQAALVLLGRLVQREEPNLRRYVAILGNPALRKQVFDL